MPSSLSAGASSFGLATCSNPNINNVYRTCIANILFNSYEKLLRPWYNKVHHDQRHCQEVCWEAHSYSWLDFWVPPRLMCLWQGKWYLPQSLLCIFAWNIFWAQNCLDVRKVVFLESEKGSEPIKRDGLLCHMSVYDDSLVTLLSAMMQDGKSGLTST